MNALACAADDPADEVDGGYWRAARRPWPTLLFVLPLILVYELGVVWLRADPAALRNGADCWLRSWMLHAGLVYPWALPAILVGGLLAWQIAGRHPWQCSVDTLTGMCGESLLFALLLVVCGQALNVLFREWGLETLSVGAAAGAAPQPLVRAISFLGAGIYEELMFRLALLPVLFYLLRALLLPRGVSLLLAVVAGSVVFAAAHYVDPSAPLAAGSLSQACRTVLDDSSLWYGFSFRLLAGLLFSVLLLLRGFGITVGCHACYDLLAGVVMQAPDALG